MSNDTLDAEDFSFVVHKDVYRHISCDAGLASQGKHLGCFTMRGPLEQRLGIQPHRFAAPIRIQRLIGCAGGGEV